MDIQKLVNPGVLRVKPYTPGRSAAEVMREYGLSEVIKLASNESALGVPAEAVEALKKAADGVFVYPDPVSTELRKALAGIHGCDPGYITVANGADGVIYELAMALIGEDDECIYPAVTFPMYENVVNIMRGRPVVTTMRGYRIDLDAMLAAVTPKTKVMFLTNPNNPTGDVLPAIEVREFLRKVPPEVLVVLDEAYIQFAPSEADPGSIALLTGGMENLVILRTFSKIYGLAGIRVGYGIAHPGLVNIIHTIKPPFTVSAAAEAMALAALGSGDFFDRVITDVKASRAYFYSRLDALKVNYAQSSTNFILIDTGYDAKEVFERLMKKGIIIRPAAGYGLPTCIRVTFGTERQNEVFFHTFEKVLDDLNNAR